MSAGPLDAVINSVYVALSPMGKLNSKAMTLRTEIGHLANAGTASQWIAACLGKCSDPFLQVRLSSGLTKKPTREKYEPLSLHISFVLNYPS